jgi:tRNA pseudouridine55 synthase
MTTTPSSGVLVVDKPVGPTSHDVVDRVRRTLRFRRAGHTGTLDPLASGVLPVCVGKATRLVQFLSGGEKVYRAAVRLGFATTTDDAGGEPLSDPRPVRVTRAEIEAASRALVGDIEQVPPAFSAKRTEGKRHYDLARAGCEPDRRPCAVTVHALEIVSEPHDDTFEMEVTCSAGTYIRALARDIGQRLGTGGHLAALRRVRSGAFSLEEAVTLDALKEQGMARLIPMGRLLPEMPEVRLGAPGVEAVRHGRMLGPDLVLSGFPDAPPERLRLLDEGGALVALARPKGFGAEIPDLPIDRVLHPDIVLLD